VHNLVSLLHDKQHETKQTSGSSGSQVVKEAVRKSGDVSRNFEAIFNNLTADKCGH
jgi:hypothetical protein